MALNTAFAKLLPVLRPSSQLPAARPVGQNQAVEWLGGMTGLAGAAALAWPNSYSGWGFAAFLISNVSWLWYGIRQRLWPMVAMQGGFTLINIFGVANWLILAS